MESRWGEMANEGGVRVIPADGDDVADGIKPERSIGSRLGGRECRGCHHRGCGGETLYKQEAGSRAGRRITVIH